MTTDDNFPDIIEGLLGASKSGIARVPGLGEAIAGWDAYNRSKFERNIKKLIEDLNDKVDNLSEFFSDEWLNSEDGQQFCRKVFDSIFDAQLEDKQKLFISALINGINDKQIEFLEKLHFVDILRHLSRASLLILADMHTMFKDNVKGPGRSDDSLKALPYIDPNKVAEQLSEKYHPYLVTSAIHELQGQGLFSNVGEWRKGHKGAYIQGSGFQDGYSYTDFTYRFVEFITIMDED